MLAGIWMQCSTDSPGISNGNEQFYTFYAGGEDSVPKHVFALEDSAWCEEAQWQLIDFNEQRARAGVALLLPALTCVGLDSC